LSDTPRQKNSHHLDTRAILVLALLYLAVSLPFLGGPPLFDPDEGYYPETASEMLVKGDLLDPVFNDSPRWGKPVGFYLAEAVSMRALGKSEFAARLPSLLAGLGFTLVTASAGAVLLGAATGLTAGVICATAIMPSVYSRSAVPDMFLAFFIALSLLAFLKATWRRESPAGPWLCIMYVSAALAFLSKGPLGAILPTIAIGGYLLASGQWRQIPRLKIVRGVLLFAAVAAPWYCYMYSLHGQDFLVEHFIGRNLQRYFTNRWEHAGPPWYYLPVLIAGTFPWTVAFAAGVYTSIRKVLSRTESARPHLFLLCWLVGMLVFFSFSRSKLPNYVLPLLPSALILAAHLIQRLMERGSGGRALAWSTSALAAAIVLVGAILLGRKLGEPPTVILLWLSPIALVALSAVLTYRPGGLWNWVRVNALAMALFFGVLTGVAIPRVERIQAIEQLAGDCQGQLAPGSTVATWRVWKPSFLFYTGTLAYRFNPDEESWPPSSVSCKNIDWVLIRADKLEEVVRLTGRKAALVYNRNRYALVRLAGSAN
jgi:4-amino-4-deoxy-L-arabinose transferase-like glycosyltransferase